MVVCYCWVKIKVIGNGKFFYSVNFVFLVLMIYFGCQEVILIFNQNYFGCSSWYYKSVGWKVGYSLNQIFLIVRLIIGYSGYCVMGKFFGWFKILLKYGVGDWQLV